MFKLLSRQAVKALPRPGLRLSTGTSCWIHSLQLPYSGPPSYETIARRFSSSEVDPLGYYTRKHNEEVKERGEFVDIHDIGRDPEDYDVLITDIKHETLETTIAEKVGIPYLSKATGIAAKEVVQVGDGFIYGPKKRTIVPMVVTHQDEARWIFFILDSGVPLTYLSVQACKVLGIRELGPVTIGGHIHLAQESPANSHFTDINLLGTDFCFAHKIHASCDYGSLRAKLYFGGGWEMGKSRL